MEKTFSEDEEQAFSQRRCPGGGGRIGAGALGDFVGQSSGREKDSGERPSGSGSFGGGRNYWRALDFDRAAALGDGGSGREGDGSDCARGVCEILFGRGSWSEREVSAADDGVARSEVGVITGASADVSGSFGRTTHGEQSAQSARKNVCRLGGVGEWGISGRQKKQKGNLRDGDAHDGPRGRKGFLTGRAGPDGKDE